MRKSSGIGENLDFKDSKCKKRMLEKLVVGCKHDEILNIKMTLHACLDKHVHYCFPYIMFPVILRLLLVVAVCGNCFYYHYTKHYLRDVLPH